MAGIAVCIFIIPHVFPSADVSIAKNYLSIDEMQEPNEIVTMYPDYATRQARHHIPMAMADWASMLDAFLQFNGAEIFHSEVQNHPMFLCRLSSAKAVWYWS